MSWFPKRLEYLYQEDIEADTQDRNNRYANQVEDEDFERIVVRLPSEENIDGSSSPTSDISC